MSDKDSLWPFSTPQGPSLIPKSKADTLQSITASIQKTASKTPPAIQSTPAGKPTPGPGFSSKGNPEKMEYSPLPEGRIPVLPLRYALSDKTLATLKDKGAAVRTTPSMISDADGFEIVRIRRGFIYVFYPSETEKSKQWEVYRYETAQGDTNSTEGRSDTNEKPIAPTHSFVKYDLKTIKDINWQVNRDIGPTSTVPVRADQSTFSIAYSEFRWPYAFFLAVERDNSFQAKMMTIVETERKKSPYYTSLSELEKISNYFSIEGVNLNAWEEENQVKVGDYLTRHVDADKLIDVNELRYTKNYPEQINSIWLSEKYQNKGKIVVFKDTVGEHLDINAYLELQSELLEKYVDERKYPISTGKVIESILKEQEKATSELSGRRTQRNLKKNEREYGFFERHAMNLDEELHPDFKELFGEIIAGVDGQNNLLDEVISNAHLYMERYDGWYTLVDEIESLIGAGYSKEDQELVSYNSINLTRVFYGLNNTKNGNEYLNALFNKVRPKRQDGTSVLYYEMIESSLSAAGVVKAIKILEGMSGLGTIDTLSYNVLNGVGRFFSFFSYPLSEGFKYGNDKFNKIVQFFYKAEPKKIKSTQDIRETMTDVVLGNSGQSRTQLDDAIDRGVQQRNAGTSSPNHANQYFDEAIDITMYKPRTDFKQFANDVSNNVTRIDGFELFANTFGALAGAITIVDNFTKLNQPVKSDNAFVRFTLSPYTQIVGAFLDVLAGIASNQGNVLKTNLQGAIVRQFFKKGVAVSTATQSKTSGLGRATRVLTGAAGIMTAVLSLGALIDSYKKDDVEGIVGNSLWVLSPSILIYAASREALTVSGYALAASRIPIPFLSAIAYLFLICGFISLFFTRNDLQSWVYNGFWGNSKRLHEDSDRIDMDIAVRSYQRLNDKNLKRVSYLDKFYDSEMSNLYQLSSFIEIGNYNKKDTKLSLVSSLFNHKNVVDKIHLFIELTDRDFGKRIDHRHMMDSNYEIIYSDKGLCFAVFDISGIESLKDYYRMSRVFVRFFCVYEDENFSKKSEWFSIPLEDI